MIDKETGEIFEDIEETGESDFGFYGEEAEEENIRGIEGVTDVVSKYVFSGMEFPCLCLKDNINLPQYKWVAISKLVKQGSVGKNISFYISRGGEMYKAGALSGIQIKSIIDLIGLDSMVGFQNKDTQLSEDKIYVLMSIY